VVGAACGLIAAGAGRGADGLIADGAGSGEAGLAGAGAGAAGTGAGLGETWGAGAGAAGAEGIGDLAGAVLMRTSLSFSPLAPNNPVTSSGTSTLLCSERRGNCSGLNRASISGSGSSTWTWS
jgi:hypothetical protein